MPNTDLIERLRWLAEDYDGISFACENEYGGAKAQWEQDREKAKQAVLDAIAFIEQALPRTA